MVALSLSLPSTSYTHRHTHGHGHGCPRLLPHQPQSKLFNPRPARSNISASASAHPPLRYLQHQHHPEQDLLFFHPLIEHDSTIKHTEKEDEEEEMVVAKLRFVAAAAADRAEMHDGLAQQRDGWNQLFLPAFNNFTLAALILSAMPNSSFASALLYGTTAALMCLVNKLQPSQLAEEQRIAARRFRQLNTDIHTNLALPPHLRQEQHPHSFLDKALKSVLALDKAYPLPLFPGMLDKFPKTVQPAVWWSQEEDLEEAQPLTRHDDNKKKRNGWSAELEQDLGKVSELLKSSDVPEYIGLSRKVLGVNKVLAVAAPLLTGIAGAVTLINPGSSFNSLSMVAGVLGMVANTLSHGGQIGMVFEMYRNSAGFYHLLDSSIQRTLRQPDPHQRENGELFLWRLALQLGRPPHSPLSSDDSSSKFAGKLF